MNWKLILQLSLFALFMGVATVYFIPLNIEPTCWLAIFIFCAYKIAHGCATLRYVHGLLLGLANCVWVTAAHVLLFSQYLASHPNEAAALLSRFLPTHPRLSDGDWRAGGGIGFGRDHRTLVGDSRQVLSRLPAVRKR